jgi:hypothetical protein
MSDPGNESGQRVQEGTGDQLLELVGDRDVGRGIARPGVGTAHRATREHPHVAAGLSAPLGTHHIAAARAAHEPAEGRRMERARMRALTRSLRQAPRLAVDERPVRVGVLDLAGVGDAQIDAIGDDVPDATLRP